MAFNLKMLGYIERLSIENCCLPIQIGIKFAIAITFMDHAIALAEDSSKPAAISNSGEVELRSSTGPTSYSENTGETNPLVKLGKTYLPEPNSSQDPALLKAQLQIQTAQAQLKTDNTADIQKNRDNAAENYGLYNKGTATVKSIEVVADGVNDIAIEAAKKSKLPGAVLVGSAISAVKAEVKTVIHMNEKNGAAVVADQGEATLGAVDAASAYSENEVNTKPLEIINTGKKVYSDVKDGHLLEGAGDTIQLFDKTTGVVISTGAKLKEVAHNYEESVKESDAKLAEMDEQVAKAKQTADDANRQVEKTSEQLADATKLAYPQTPPTSNSSSVKNSGGSQGRIGTTPDDKYQTPHLPVTQGAGVK